ncbi:2Fe-2S iron-sulfur cluster-binding protein [Spirulina major]|uniref:2Fe-2S iron-sulfur cluster-binding protein n=1 Tax=Spirulina major TaxID=270636 RepID=UPI000934D479|nr:2Fe-2S iron-sulfur cluster-binding protein [Spirulina major]
MPTVTAQGKSIPCETGANLRQVLQTAQIDLYNGNARVINCRGLGSCGTCAVKIIGPVSEPKWKERSRLSLPPHKADSGLRLACQVNVLGDITVQKCDRFWGQGDRILW